MPIHFSVALPAEPNTAPQHAAVLSADHGELLLGKVTQIDSDGVARINFAGLETRTGDGKMFQAGQRVLAHVQKTQDETLLSLLPNAREGEILDGTVVRREGAHLLARFGDSDLLARLASKTEIPQSGAQVHAQIQIQAGKPFLQLLPADLGSGEIGGTVVAERQDGSLIIEVDGATLVAASAGQNEIGEHVQARLVFIRDMWILQILPKESATDTGAPERIDAPVSTLLADSRVVELLNALASGDLRISTSQELFALLLPLASETSEQETWFSGLVRALDAIMLSPQRTELAQQLATAMENSGLFLESRLLQAAISGNIDPEISNDLKLALLLAGQKLSSTPRHASTPQQAAAERAGPSAGLAEVAGKTGQLLDTITAEQFQNVRMGATNEIYVQLPFAADSGLESVEIHISPQGKRNERKVDAANIVLTLAVTTSNLGRIKAALSIVEKRVSCRLKAERESVVDLLDSNSGILKDGLEKLDYEVAFIDCTLGKSESDLTIIRELPTAPSEGLDVRA